MKPNSTIFGNSNNWYNQYFSQNIPNQYKNKKPYFGGDNARLETAIANNKINGGSPIDRTISYCGLGVESDLSKRNSICRIGGDIVIKSADNTITNFMIWEKSGTNSFSRMNGALYNDSHYGWVNSMSSDNINRFIEPLCDIRPTNQVLELRVYAYNPDTGQISDFDLDEYCTTYYQNYYQIQSVYVVCQWGSSTPRGQGSIPNQEIYNIRFCIGVLNPYKYIDDSDVYNFALCAEDRQNQAVISGLSNIVYNINAVSDNIPIFYGDTDMYTVETTTGTMIRVYRDISNENIDDIREYYLRQAAVFGLYFTPKHNVAINGELTNADMYIGILDNNGIGHGDYLRGENTALAPQNNYISMFDTPYKPSNDNTNYLNNTLFNFQIPSKSAIKYYVMTENQVEQLFSKLYSATMDDLQPSETVESHNLKTFLTSNGIDCVTSLFRFPCNVPKQIISQNVRLGTYNTGMLAYPLLFTTGFFDFTFNNDKNNGLYPIFDNDFRDYEPYTKCELTVPFCGTTQIPCSYMYDYDDLSVKLIVDFITGVCTAVVMCNGDTIDTLSGTCGVQFPITGIQSANLDAQIFAKAMESKNMKTGLNLGIIGGAIAIGVGIATGGVGVALGGGAAVLGSFAKAANEGTKINYELKHMETPIKQIGGASSQICQSMDMRCKLLITRPKMSTEYNNEIYSNTIGFACLENGNVENFSGFTVGDINVDDIDATENEKKLIKNYFAEGVYL